MMLSLSFSETLHPPLGWDKRGARPQGHRESPAASPAPAPAPLRAHSTMKVLAATLATLLLLATCSPAEGHLGESSMAVSPWRVPALSGWLWGGLGRGVCVTLGDAGLELGVLPGDVEIPEGGRGCAGLSPGLCVCPLSSQMVSPAPAASATRGSPSLGAASAPSLSPAAPAASQE